MEYGNLYNEENVMIAATHSHSGAAGTSQYMMYNLMNAGFIQQTFDAFLEGTYYVSLRRQW